MGCGWLVCLWFIFSPGSDRLQLEFIYYSATLDTASDPGDRWLQPGLRQVATTLDSPIGFVLLAKLSWYLVVFLTHLPLPVSWFLSHPRTTHSASWRLDAFKGSSYRRM